jgi:chromosome segregation ATPase
VVPSTTYANGVFQLHVQSGAHYSCKVPQQASADACLTSQSHADVTVDPVEARLTLLEAKQGQLQDENCHLKQQLEEKDRQLETANANLTSYLHQLENRLDAKDVQLDSMVAQLNAKDVQLDSMVAQLNAKDTQLDSKDASLTNSLQALTSKISLLPSFTFLLTLWY